MVACNHCRCVDAANIRMLSSTTSVVSNRTLDAFPCAVGRRVYQTLRYSAAGQSVITRSTDRSATSCVVIGGGIGGLVTAAKLQQEGLNVTILEQNPQVGGRCQSVVIDGYRFDTGPSLLLFPNTYKQTFAWLGSRLEDHVQIAKVQEAAYRVFYAPGADNELVASHRASNWLRSHSSCGDGSTITQGTSAVHPINQHPQADYLDLLYDVQAMVDQLEREEPGAGTQYLSWLSEARKALVVGTREFIERDFDNIWDFLDLRRLLPLIGQVDLGELLGNHHQRLMQRFKSPRLAALLSLQDLYIGLSPHTAPGVFSLLAATEITDGVWTPIGGFGKVRDGLLAVAQQHGVRVRTSCRVVFINTSNHKVTGVTLEGGEVVPADMVVANRDVSMSYGLCDSASGLQPKQRQLAAQEFSAGVIAYYWCVNKRLEGLRHHNVFLSDQFKASWNRARTPDEFQRYPNFYIHAPTRTDPTAAPPGCDSIMVLLPVANMQQRNGDGDYQGIAVKGKQLVLRSMQAAGVQLQESDICHEEVRDPSQWRDLYGLEHGSAFGLSHGLSQLALFRPAVKDDRVKGLYFTGASSRPGNGVPLVMIGGRLTAERILKDLR